MNKYNALLSNVSRKYCINRGARETEDEWKTRLIYSICGMMAYASLWDDSEEGPISIVHLKRRVRNILASYRLMYPELADYLPYFSEKLEDEIANTFLSAGIVYHCPNHIVSAMRREELYGGILFQRGIALDSITCVSGVGFYSKRNGVADTDGIRSMFGLAQENLQTLWNSTLAAATWDSNLLSEYNTEYLRLKPPFSKGYWTDKPNTAGKVSILRTGLRGSQLYYLYRYSGTALEVCPLPQWQVESHRYRSLACACLCAYGTLPPIEYFEDGALVHIRMNYLLPPRELAFLKLFSWPETCTTLPYDFRRKISAEVFSAIKDMLSDQGYQFTGGTI